MIIVDLFLIWSVVATFGIPGALTLTPCTKNGAPILPMKSNFHTFLISPSQFDRHISPKKSDVETGRCANVNTQIKKWKKLTWTNKYLIDFYDLYQFFSSSNTLLHQCHLSCCATICSLVASRSINGPPYTYTYILYRSQLIKNTIEMRRNLFNWRLENWINHNFYDDFLFVLFVCFCIVWLWLLLFICWYFWSANICNLIMKIRIGHE